MLLPQNQSMKRDTPLNMNVLDQRILNVEPGPPSMVRAAEYAFVRLCVIYGGSLVAFAVAAERFWPGNWPLITRLLGWRRYLDNDEEDDLHEGGEEDLQEEDGVEDWQDIEGEVEEEDAYGDHPDHPDHPDEDEDDVMDAIDDDEAIDDVLEFWRSFPCLVAILGFVIVDFLTTSFDSMMWTFLYWMGCAAVGFQLAFMAFTFNHGMLHWNSRFGWDDFRSFWWWPL